MVLPPSMMSSASCAEAGAGRPRAPATSAAVAPKAADRTLRRVRRAPWSMATMRLLSLVFRLDELDRETDVKDRLSRGSAVAVARPLARSGLLRLRTRGRFLSGARRLPKPEV